jgi:hypothetical protein
MKSEGPMRENSNKIVTGEIGRPLLIVIPKLITDMRNV